MSRPKPTVLLEKVEKETYKTEQVLASQGIWAVYYDKKPINLKNIQYANKLPWTQIQKGFL